MEEQGVIVEIKGELAKVAITPQYSCAHCAARALCPQSGGKVYTEALNPWGAQVGDLVKVEMPAKRVYQSTFLIFFMPLIGLALGFVIGQKVGFSQGLSILTGLLFAGGWLFLLGRMERRRTLNLPKPIIKRAGKQRRKEEQ